MGDNDIPFSWRNWFYLRCVLRKCPFMADSMGAGCTTPRCNARMPIYFNQVEQWRSMVKLYERDTQDYFEMLRNQLLNKGK